MTQMTSSKINNMAHKCSTCLQQGIVENDRGVPPSENGESMVEPLISERCEDCGDLISSQTPIHGNILGVVGNKDHSLPLTAAHGHALALHVVEASCHEHYRNEEERQDLAPPGESGADNGMDMEGQGQGSTGNNGGGDAEADSRFLAIIFALFVVFGTCNAVMGKMIMIPMYNYPVFLNVWICILYAIVCCAYVFPAVRVTKTIPREQLELAKWPFAVMAVFDCLATLMVMMASTYLPGPLLVLLPQAAIPFSMLFSAILLKARYGAWHYFGATTVLVGIGVVLEPLFSNRHSPDFICVATMNHIEDFCTICEQQYTKEACLVLKDPLMNDNHGAWLLDDNIAQKEGACTWESTSETESNSGGSSLMVVWSFVMILSTVPMTLSSIYKETYSNKHDIDPVYINLWIVIFQLLYSFPLSVPAGYASTPAVPISELPQNFWNGLKCFFGISSVMTGCHPDEFCPIWGPLGTMAFLFVNGFYSILMILILKHGSANLMFLALTLVIPASNLWFALPFMPGQTPIHASDLTGLFVIMIGLVCYRFGSSIASKIASRIPCFADAGKNSKSSLPEEGARVRLLEEYEEENQTSTNSVPHGNVVFI